MINIENVNYRISNKSVLSNLSVKITEGQYYALSGENGAGKSTLIKIILDLIRNIESGEIHVNKLDNKLIKTRKYISYLPEKFEVNKDVSGWLYLEFINQMYHHIFDKLRIIELCSLMDLKPDKLNDKVSTYSKGMKQKLGLISCFMLKTPLIILDEPLSGLDPKARFSFKKLLMQERQNNRTIFYSTHMLADAEEICDRFGILHQGRIVFDGTPAECIDRYQTATLEQAYMRCITETEAKQLSA